jgi:putative serine protease PepD
MARMSRLLAFVAGAVSVGAVIGVLAIAGVVGGSDTTIVRSQPTPSAPAPRSGDSTAAVSDVYARVSPGVVFVQANSGKGQLPFPGGGRAASGSGFVIDDDGHIVTNDHVVEDATQYRVRFGDNGDPIVAKLLGTDPSADLALLKIDPKDVPDEISPLRLGSSSDVRPGDEAIAIGSPFGLEGTVTSGIVSALGRTIQAPNGFSISGAVQTDAAINPGNSGGPLLDGNGRVIGVNSQIKTDQGGDNSGVGFAVPVSTIKQVVPQIQSGGKVVRAYLGVSNSDSPDHSGAVVQDVVQNGPAEKGGLQLGDKITAINDKPILSSDDVSAAVNNLKPGEKAKLTVVRGGDRRTLNVELGTRPDRPGTP